ncbi:unnamed protein product [Hanseniaspora opuntiae]
MQKKEIPADLKQLIESDANKCTIENYKPLKDINGTIDNPPPQPQPSINNSSPQMPASNPPSNIKQQQSPAIPPTLNSPQMTNKEQKINNTCC